MNIKEVGFTDEERAEIMRKYTLRHENHVCKRLPVLLLKAIDGTRSEETAKISGLCLKSVNKIVNRYQAQGWRRWQGNVLTVGIGI